MRVVNISSKNGDTSDLLAALKGRVFHLTTQSIYDAILKLGEIVHNKDERFELNTSPQNSFGRLMGYVCFFDLRNDSPELLSRTLECYYFLGPSWFGNLSEAWTEWDLAYLILDPAYYDRLLPNNKVHEHYKETGKFLHAIPGAEVWIEDRVPITWIESVLLANIRKAAPERNSWDGLIHRDVFRDSQNRSSS
jgi:hypothetical protein